MSASPESDDAQHLSQIKKVVNSLYRVRGHTREDVVRLLKERHGFETTKAQWEKLLKDTGIHKNTSAKDWRTVAQKLETRKRKGKDSEVYHNGQLMCRKRLRKEISRHGVMTIDEKIQRARAGTPQTPPAFDIRTPCDQQVLQLMFTNLPILKFQSTEAFRQLSNSINSIDPNKSALTLIFKDAPTTCDTIKSSIVKSMLPSALLFNENITSGSTLTLLEDLHGPVLLNLTFYLASNNFPGKASSAMIYTLLKTHGSTHVLDVLLSKKDSTSEAVVEKIFRAAVEAADVPVVKHFLDAGLDIKGHVCRHEDIPDNLSPMQFACITRNAALARVLIQAGSVIDEPGCGWRSSALVLAISGVYYLGSADKASPTADHISDRITQDTVDEYDVGNLDYDELKDQVDTKGMSDNQYDSNILLSLISTLLDAGASVNPSGNLYTAGSISSKYSSLFHDGHSPLTAAAKFRQHAVVELLLHRGADVNFITHNGTSSLQECLYSWEQWHLDTSAKPLSERSNIFPGCNEPLKIITTIQYLLQASPSVNYGAVYKGVTGGNGQDSKNQNDYFYDVMFSSLDLAILSKNERILELLLTAGAAINEHSFATAVEVQDLYAFSRLLGTGIQPSKAVMQLVAQHLPFTAEFRPVALDFFAWNFFAQVQDIATQRLVLLKAMREGYYSRFLKILLTYKLDLVELFENNSGVVAALEGCCRSFSALSFLRYIAAQTWFIESEIRPLLGCSIHAIVSSPNSFGEIDRGIDILIRAGADINATSADLGGETAIFAAVKRRDVRIVQRLIFWGADLNVESTAYKTALLLAVENHDRKIAEELIEKGARLERRTRCSNCTLDLHYPSGDILVEAVAWGDMEIIKLLIQRGASVDQPGRGTFVDPSDENPCRLPLTVAIQMKHQVCAEYLISRNATVENPPEIFKSETPLSAAISNNDKSLIPILLKAGADPGHPLALKAAVDDLMLFQDLIVELIGRCNIPQGANFGCLALGEAIRKRRREMVEFILQSHVADVNAYPYQYSELSAGIRLDESFDLPVVDMSPKATQRASVSPVFCPLQLAADCGDIEITRALLNYDAEPNASSHPDYTKHFPTPIQIATCSRSLEMMRLLLERGANPNSVSKRMPDTALQYASEHGDEGMVELLLEYGADVNSPPAIGYGATALQYASSGGYLGIAAVLLEHGANVNAAGAVSGWTALEVAAAYGRIDMVKLLLNAGAEVHADGHAQYERAVLYASYNGHLVTKRLLEEHHG